MLVSSYNLSVPFNITCMTTESIFAWISSTMEPWGSPFILNLLLATACCMLVLGGLQPKISLLAHCYLQGHLLVCSLDIDGPSKEHGKLLFSLPYLICPQTSYWPRGKKAVDISCTLCLKPGKLHLCLQGVDLTKCIYSCTVLTHSQTSSVEHVLTGLTLPLFPPLMTTCGEHLLIFWFQFIYTKLKSARCCQSWHWPWLR